MEHRMLGTSGLTVSALGLGCMGMSMGYGSVDIPSAEATLLRAIDLGITFFDTADVYGDGHNEELIGRVLKPFRENIVIATKFALNQHYEVSGRPEYVRAAVEGSLRRLDTDYIDLYYQHRVDPTVPIEETVGAMAELVTAGKVRHLGLSEASATTIARAAAVHPIAALQSEWSLWTRDIEAEVLGTARSHGVGLVPYSPLGRGFLTGSVVDMTVLPEKDMRQNTPRFSGENFEHNKQVLATFSQYAADLGCTPGQLALAWVLGQGTDVVPIPGTKRVAYLEENVGALEIKLTADQLAELAALMASIVGARYARSHTYGDSPSQSAS